MSRRKQGGEGVFDDTPSQAGMSSAAQRLLSYVQRLEQLDAEAAEIRERKKDVREEIKAAGFDTATVAKVLSLRRMDEEKRTLLKLYADQLNVFD